MTKTLVSPKLFSHKILLSLQFLQGLSRKKDGATARRITSYIKTNFPNDGDMASQVRASLDECVDYGFVRKLKNKYILVGPIASIQMQPHNSQHRMQEVERARKIFPYDWKHSRRRQYCQRERAPNNGTITSFLKAIKNWLFGNSPSYTDDLVLPKRVYNRRVMNLGQFGRTRRHKRCSRNGCTTSRTTPKSDFDTDRQKASKRSSDMDSMSCNELKKRRDKLRSETSRMLEKYNNKCDRGKSKRKNKQTDSDAYSFSASQSSDDTTSHHLR
ncbi:hypothetical protein AMK59_2887 [Oryctes borbonicus]|uniref:Uncharacterized protein n=1 Tax=Oryctes borbonicus TaxID=1629725 RepID=A0A0T6BD94_9SCAR|nr:hypothetical protein AMK59_2887 [Oryctes borbonicus]